MPGQHCGPLLDEYPRFRLSFLQIDNAAGWGFCLVLKDCAVDQLQKPKRIDLLAQKRIAMITPLAHQGAHAIGSKSCPQRLIHISQFTQHLRR